MKLRETSTKYFRLRQAFVFLELRLKRADAELDKLKWYDEWGFVLESN